MTARGRGPRPVGDRLRRLLVMLPWLMERGSAPVAEMAATFSLDESDLVRDLELAALCGLPPFVDEMIDVFIDEGVVHAGVPRLFTRPLRLTAPEGFALLIAGRAALTLPGADPDGPLARALGKLAAILGDDGVVVDVPQPPATAAMIEAATDGARLRIEYWSSARDEVATREITPRAVFADRGHWYVIADDRRSGERRTFRVDRVESLERTGDIDPVAQPVAVPGPDDWFADADLPVATLRLDRSARWVAERYPIRASRELGDALEIDLSITSERWLRSLLLRLGPHADVVEPATWRTLGADAAAELLDRYAARRNGAPEPASG